MEPSNVKYFQYTTLLVDTCIGEDQKIFRGGLCVHNYKNQCYLDLISLKNDIFHCVLVHRNEYNADIFKRLFTGEPRPTAF